MTYVPCLCSQISRCASKNLTICTMCKSNSIVCMVPCTQDDIIWFTRIMHVSSNANTPLKDHMDTFITDLLGFSTYVYQLLLWLNTMAKATKNAACPATLLSIVPNYKNASTTTKPLQYTFFDWCRNEFGSSERYLSMFTSFYYDWTLAEAAKNAALPHCCWVPTYQDATTTTKLLQINLPWLV